MECDDATSDRPTDRPTDRPSSGVAGRILSGRATKEVGTSHTRSKLFGRVSRPESARLLISEATTPAPLFRYTTPG